MKKIVAGLDDQQREALLVLVDWSAAVSSAGLIVAILTGVVDLLF
jgi:hypothetical protein